MSRSEETALPTPQEATVYTNIDPATEQKLTLGSETTSATSADGNNVYVLDPGEDVDTINDDVMDMSTFRATYNGIPGTFTCADGTNCVEIATSTITGGQIIITNTNFADDGWTFESDDFVETSATQDADYMYFGYWLQSPENPTGEMPEYMFTTFSGGIDDFMIPDVLTKNDDEALAATYVGGAAGRYVTRKLRIKDQVVDILSPGYHGRFTATATLEAHFGEHDDFDVDPDVEESVKTQNTIGGTITDFMDGATDLGFEITLERTEYSSFRCDSQWCRHGKV